MQVIGSGGAALRAIVDDEVTGKRIGQCDDIFNLSSDSLRPVVAMHNGHVPIEDRKGIAVDREFGVERQPFLFRRQVGGTEKTRSPGNGFAIHGRSSADDTMR